MPERFTNSFVSQLQIKDKRYIVFDSIVQGLFVSVLPSGRKTFNIQYTCESSDGTSKRNSMKIGDASVLSVTQAREKAKDLLAQATLGANIDKRARRKENPLLSDIVEEYKKVWAPLHSGRQQALERMTVNFSEFMDLPISELRLIDIETWRVNLLEKNKASDELQHETDISSVPQQRTNTNDARQLIRHTQKAIKRNTINRYMSQLQAMLNWAAEREIIPSNPIAGLKKLRETDSLEVTRYLSDDERQRLYDALDAREEELRAARRRSRMHQNRRYLPDLDKVYFADHLKPMVLTAINTGIRRNALFSLRWEDIDLGTRSILLKAKNAKSQKSLIIPINDVVFNTLSHWKQQTQPSTPHGLVFPNPETGKKFDTLKKAWAELLIKADIKNFRWHDMRHDFASRLVMNGIDLNTVRELLGHSNLTMTMRYAHLAPERKKAAVNSLR
ncbi:tyrosine-type recombinase/integrase [uncultured Cloacibacillus sp.]|uniref:tyrosine-type recombinase/integrase n=1 Tax=uncultured Cloacibacillus sp. TaxID=889794 RepID=UPI00320A4545